MTGSTDDAEIEHKAAAYMAEQKWVRIMNDYAAHGVWGKDGGAYYPRDLPISKELQDRILAWAEAFEDDDASGESLAKDGLAIAQAVKGELPDWKVIYFDDAAYTTSQVIRSLEDHNTDRSFFEYEITLA